LPPGTLAAKACAATRFEVNSSHHQAAQMIGGGLVISGWAPDSIIEAVELAGQPFVLGVQWHPEEMLERAEQARIFGSFITAVRG
jgi:putative glutamine amidotransferase